MRGRRKNEGGYILLVLLVMVTLAMIALGAAMPRIIQEARREREDELLHRGHEYERAIQLYFRRFGRYPASLDQLENTNNLRFLRRRYKDPITGKDEWRLIHLGEALAKPKGAVVNGATPAGQASGAPGGSPFVAAGTGSGAMPFGGTPPNGQTALNPDFGGNPNPGAPQPTGSDPQNQNSFGSPGAGLASGPNGQNGQGGPGNFGGAASNFGGGLPIVGVASTSNKKSIKIIDGKDHYNEWEFVYDPTMDRSGRGTGGVGIPGGAAGGSIGGTLGMPGGGVNPNGGPNVNPGSGPGTQQIAPNGNPTSPQ